MPDIRNDETVEAIAQEYTSNGHNKSQALIKVGYDEVNARSGKGLKVYENPRLTEAIANIEAKTAKKCGYSREKQLKKLDEARDHAVTLDAPSAEVSAIRAQNLMLGYDQEKAPNEEAELARANRMSEEDRALNVKYSNQRCLEIAKELGIKAKTG